MSTPTNDGGPAFPCKVERDGHGCTWKEHLPGMSLRDYFAGQAAAGALAHSADDWDLGGLARYAYKVADAMIAEREKGGQ